MNLEIEQLNEKDENVREQEDTFELIFVTSIFKYEILSPIIVLKFRKEGRGYNNEDDSNNH